MVKAVIYDYSKEPPEIITLVGNDSQNSIFKSLKKGARLELALQEDGFEPITTGHYLKLADDSVIPPTPTGVLWDSNINGKWNNGIRRIVTDHHGYDPYDPLTEVAAGENRKWEIVGDGTCFLSGARARVYNHTKQIAGNKYQWDIHYVHNSTLDNMSLEFFSRHNEDDPPENRFGGEILSFHKNDIEFDEEHWHNERNGGDSHSLSSPISDSSVTKLKVIGEKSVISNSVTFKFDVFVNEKLEWHKEHKSPEYNAAVKEALYWRFRTNGSDPQNVKILLSRISKI